MYIHMGRKLWYRTGNKEHNSVNEIPQELPAKELTTDVPPVGLGFSVVVVGQ